LWVLWNQRLDHSCDVSVLMYMLPCSTIVLAIPACKHWQLPAGPLWQHVYLLLWSFLCSLHGLLSSVCLKAWLSKKIAQLSWI